MALASLHVTPDIIDYVFNLMRTEQALDAVKQDLPAISIPKDTILSILEPSCILSNHTSTEIIGSIFYAVNCLQESDPTPDQLDGYRRFTYAASYQFEQGSIQTNRVQVLLQYLADDCNIKLEHKNSEIFISHDIDFLYSARKEEVEIASKHWDLGLLFKLIIKEYILSQPLYRNIDQILRLDSEYDIRSTFFWLVNEGKGVNGIPNADYTFDNEKKALLNIEKANCFNGLHKSATADAFEEEIEKSGQNWIYNRNHFLKFQTQEHWKAIVASDIKLDCSLGFAEHYGFRNSYGKPFRPYDFEHQKPYDFVEMPLHIMDATFKHYLKTDADKIGQTVIDFIEKNRQDCVLSLLWHNNYLTEYSYQPYLKAYKQILAYVYESKLASVTPQEILDEYLK